MSNRWYASRIGFVNFWLYDEETFDFENGKLLLRGENASGKSITTQSIIPFILDGDRSPERLDPFGSRDRKMEYYFLGDKDVEESTGYIFLEFVKKDSMQYRTIGIGQRACKGKAMTFWGFVILDNKRIGSDIQLYKQVGDKRIPKTKQELKNDLGETNIIVESQREYMKLVNKHIFGFPNIELYDQFIKLLIKVRAPKLSKDLKPSLVYTVLNDSLQTLSDDDLSAMVDVMEQLDTMQSEIDDLKETLKNIVSIRAEYDRYNRYLLGTKAKNYQANHKTYEQLCNKLDNNIKETTNNATAILEFKVRNEHIIDLIKMHKNEIEMLDSKEIDQQVIQREKLINEQETLKKEIVQQSEKHEDIQEKLQNNKIQVNKTQIEIDDNRYNFDNFIKEINELSESINFDMNVSFDAFDHQADFCDVYESNLKAYKSNITKGLAMIKNYNDQEQLFSKSNEKLSIAASKVAALKQEAIASQKSFDQIKDNLIEKYHILNKENKVMIFDPLIFNELLHSAQFYNANGDYKKIDTLCSSTYRTHEKALYNELKTCEFKANELIETISGFENELVLLQEMKEIVPIRRDKVIKTRAYLQKENVTFQPFYELVDFNSNVSENERDLLEEQLSMSGMLDALLIKEEDYERIKNQWDSLSDVVLIPKTSLSTSFSKLQVSNLNHPLALATQNILNSISSDPSSDAEIVLTSDGYYRNGLLEGHATSDHKYAFIGALTRKASLEEKIAEKKAECAAVSVLYQKQKNYMESINESIAMLDIEFDSLPKYESIEDALINLKNILNDTEQGEKLYNEIEQEVNSISSLKNKAYQEMLLICKAVPMERKIDVYEDALSYLEDLIGVFQRAYRLFEKCKRGEERLLWFQNDILDKQNAIEELSLIIVRKQNEQDTNQTLIEKINSFLDSSENKDVIEKIKEAHDMLTKLVFESNQNEKAIIEKVVQSNEHEKQIAEIKEIIDEEKSKDELLYTCFEEEIKLGYIIKKDELKKSDYLSEACACTRPQDTERSISDVTSALDKNFQQHVSSLAKYGSRLDPMFDDHPQFLRRRQVINSTFSGRIVSLNEFYDLIKEEIENNELLLDKKDRELFENILSNTLSQKLSNRIIDSKTWVDEMSKLMGKMDTSMGLTFSLKWKAKAPENDNELSFDELNTLLRRDSALLTNEDNAKVSKHFRSKIQIAKGIAEDKGELFNYQDLIRDALDYRKWYEFQMRYRRANGEWKELTNNIFNTYSGGEKAMAMYVPLFASVNAQYKKCEREDHPRIIALDEAYAGVDDKNIDAMFKLLETIDLDYIMNSQALWGCYPSVSNLHISELLRPANSDVVTVINYRWNGLKREVID